MSKAATMSSDSRGMYGMNTPSKPPITHGNTWQRLRPGEDARPHLFRYLPLDERVEGQLPELLTQPR